jgi:hypothetical protein
MVSDRWMKLTASLKEIPRRHYICLSWPTGTSILGSILTSLRAHKARTSMQRAPSRLWILQRSTRSLDTKPRLKVSASGRWVIKHVTRSARAVASRPKRCSSRCSSDFHPERTLALVGANYRGRHCTATLAGLRLPETTSSKTAKACEPSTRAEMQRALLLFHSRFFGPQMRACNRRTLLQRVKVYSAADEHVALLTQWKLLLRSGAPANTDRVKRVFT